MNASNNRIRRDLHLHYRKSNLFVEHVDVPVQCTTSGPHHLSSVPIFAHFGTLEIHVISNILDAFLDPVFFRSKNRSPKTDYLAILSPNKILESNCRGPSTLLQSNVTLKEFVFSDFDTRFIMLEFDAELISGLENSKGKVFTLLKG